MPPCRAAELEAAKRSATSELYVSGNTLRYLGQCFASRATELNRRYVH